MAERTGVYVLGMHRSGTSALARVIDLLGVPVAEKGLLGPSRDNPAGYWEPQDLVGFNIKLLYELGGRTMAPPPIEISAHAAHLLREHIPAARALFRSLHTGGQWAWKDPRNSVLLPFWRAVIDDRAVAVLAYRDPSEVAASLRRRGPSFGGNAIACWEQYLRSALFASRDLPRLAVDYADLVAQPDHTIRRVESFLEAHGLRLAGQGGARRAAASIDRSLHRQRRAETRQDPLTREQQDLVRLLTEAAAAPPDVGDSSLR